MGFCHEDTGPLVGIESRGESFRLFNLADTEHIFAFENGNVEITYEFLAAFLTRLQEPEIRKALLKGDGSPAETEYFTGHSDDCDGKCGKLGASSISGDYCEQYRDRLGSPESQGGLTGVLSDIDSSPAHGEPYE